MKYLIYILLSTAILFASCESATSDSSNDKKDSDSTEVVSEPTDDNMSSEQSGSSIASQYVNYSTDETNMKGHLYYDENAEGKRPGVLIVHEWWGLNDYVKKRAEQIAELGYVAFAIDMYGQGKTADHPSDAQAFSGEVMKNFDEAKGRFVRAMEVLQNNENVNSDKIAAIGYCFGGGVVLSMANSDMEELDGVVSFHGSLGLPVKPKKGKVESKVLVLNGADDNFVTEEQINEYNSAMDKAGADYEFISYNGAKHGFTNPAADSAGAKFELPLAYNEQADKESWEEMKKFFNELWAVK